MNLLDASCRIAFAALLHDLGKFHERTGLPLAGDYDGLLTLYRYSHAAHTGGVWDVVEKFAPDLLRGDLFPFASRSMGEDITDSMANTAAAHHKPATLLQWIVATADRAASGFERQKFDEYNEDCEGITAFTCKNRFQARLVTLFEQIAPARNLDHAYPLAALSPLALFPQTRARAEPSDDKTAQAEYAALWQQFLTALDTVPKSHRANWPLWLDHFDSAWLAFTHVIPSATNPGVVPDVSLYDHSKAVAALATALWRWHHENGKVGASDTAILADRERPDWSEQKLLLIQGDFFGIQDFIFASGGQTQKHAHKLLRGRSFQVALLAELAALKLLEALQLPATSQIINAAGKFLIVAANTEAARAAVADCRRVFDAWCIEHAFGEIGVGLASTPATCNDLVDKDRGGNFKTLIDNLFAALDTAKHRRFGLCGDAPAVIATDFPHGPCAYQGRYPADTPGNDDRPASCALSRDQVKIGAELTKRARLLVLRDATSFGNALELDYFGYSLALVADEEASGKYGELARDGTLVRAWDFDQPDADGTVFRGYARRYVNSYVPRWNDLDLAEKAHGKYERFNDDDLGDSNEGDIKTLHAIAAAGIGETALVTLKGDIDNLGALFQSGLEKPTFARWAGLSRQVNAFFALWLPWFCEHGANGKFRNTYTVFAGGDDFFLIGPWQSTIELAGVMRSAFADYVAHPDITFSLGATMTHPKVPARHLAAAAERALTDAKQHPKGKEPPDKNAASLWGITVDWAGWQKLVGARRAALEELDARAGGLSTGFIYNLLQLADQAAGGRPEDALWRSRLAYRCARLVKDKATGNALAREIGDALTQHRGGYRLPVSLLLYRQRK
ncbi:MAG: type III-A CRISPR-associated protein Cas10/Csm1 [Sulfurisoma sp.]|nr:type III-A CRISPR-associated protein Cas10/Csm1 [Sulfurisoma sp.]